MRPVRHWLLNAIRASAIAALTWPTATPADEALGVALGKCMQIEEDAERLICFDAVAAMASGERAEEPPSAISPPPLAPAEVPEATTQAAASGVVPLTDDVGKERVDGARVEEPPKYAGTVTRCEESRQSGQTYFFFENGQVWKQANYRRLNLRECRFDVTVAKDTFGYELHIPSKDRRVRVSRVR